jgi:hypothetical protein
MGENLILGCGTMVVCLSVQSFVVGVLVRFLIVLEKRGVIAPTLLRSSSLLTSVMLIMLVGNLLQITVWSGLFLAVGEFEDFATAFYHSAVNFTTLGYGDQVMSEERRLLGALEAANGVLKFGLTTGLLYTVLSVLMRRAWDRQVAQSEGAEESLAR